MTNDLISFEDVMAIEISDDIDKPNKYMTKDGEWHEGMIPMSSAEIVMCDSGAINLAEAIVGFACDDIVTWMKEVHKQGWDFDTEEYIDYLVPEIPRQTHESLRRAKTKEKKKAILSKYYKNFWWRYRNRKKNANDARAFLLGNENGWITMLTEVDGRWLYKKVMEIGENRTPYTFKKETNHDEPD